MSQLLTLLQKETHLQPNHIKNILHLLDEGATIPFIARYRKEMSGGATDEQLREFERIYIGAKKLLERKDEVSRLIAERATLTTKLKQLIEDAPTLRVLEDIYRPYKEKKATRATQAIERGLTPLANLLMGAQLTKEALKSEAKRYVKGEIKSVDEALLGAKDIIAERYAENLKEREILRGVMLRNGTLEVKAAKKFDKDGVYKNFVGKSERVAYIPSYRYLAIMRGAKEGELSVKISIDETRVYENIKRYKIAQDASSSKEIVFEAYKDGFKRLLLPSIEREVHSEIKERSDKQAIEVFGKNLTQLLMTPPVSKKVLLGVDPGFVSGCKLAVIDEDATYLDSDVIYPTKPKADYENSKRKVVALVKKYNIEGVAIGNATASRETQEFFTRLNEEGLNLPFSVVSEAGASVYSASKIAQEEYPQLDVTIRGALSIVQRLRDPMATLVKIDPKSLGIGQYQHDVNQKLLKKRLDDVTEDVVNRVGVDINSASFSLLNYVAGVTPSVAKNIVQYRQENGAFKKKSELLKVKGLGKKAYEQMAGFIRIKDAKDILDNTGVHPESYDVARVVQKLDLEHIEIAQVAQKLGVGEATLRDIVKELQKPNFDPREELEAVPFREGLVDIKMLHEGSFVSGVIRNITDFGAFVDIGLKNDALLHISKISQKRVAHPLELLSINQYLPKVEVIAVEYEKQKVSLSLV